MKRFEQTADRAVQVHYTALLDMKTTKELKTITFRLDAETIRLIGAVLKKMEDAAAAAGLEVASLTQTAVIKAAVREIARKYDVTIRATSMGRPPGRPRKEKER